MIPLIDRKQTKHKRNPRPGTAKSTLSTAEVPSVPWSSKHQRCAWSAASWSTCLTDGPWPIGHRRRSGSCVSRPSLPRGHHGIKSFHGRLGHPSCSSLPTCSQRGRVHRWTRACIASALQTRPAVWIHRKPIDARLSHRPDHKCALRGSDRTHVWRPGPFLYYLFAGNPEQYSLRPQKDATITFRGVK